MYRCYLWMCCELCASHMCSLNLSTVQTFYLFPTRLQNCRKNFSSERHTLKSEQGSTLRKSTREGFGGYKGYLEGIVGNPSLVQIQRKTNKKTKKKISKTKEKLRKTYFPNLSLFPPMWGPRLHRVIFTVGRVGLLRNEQYVGREIRQTQIHIKTVGVQHDAGVRHNAVRRNAGIRHNAGVRQNAVVRHNTGVRLNAVV